MRCCCVCGLRRAFARLCLIDVVCVAGTLATRPRGRYRGVFRSAVCAKHPMVAGTHYVEVTVVEKAHPTAANAKRGPFGTDRMGLVGEDFNAVGGGIATTSEDGWLLSTHLGAFVHDSQPGVWYGMVKVGDIKAGDVVGLLLDLEQRTLLVYLNGARCGVMVVPEMGDMDGKQVATLVGPLRWAVDMGDGAKVRIERKPPPPSPTSEEVAAAIAWNQKWCANHGVQN